MPDPRRFSNRNDFMTVCVPQVIREGSEQDQAVAVCSSMWRDRHKKDDGGGGMPDLETKYAGGKVTEVKSPVDDHGVTIGVVEGHIASFMPDQGGIFGVPDQFMRGAFLDSINEHKARNNRPVRLRDHHGRTIGKFPIDTVKEDELGLFGRGEINLEVQQGREAHALARQGTLTDFSIGFKSLDDRVEDGIRRIFKASIVEGSIVDEPLNRQAQITEVKSEDWVPLMLAEIKSELTDRELDNRAVVIAHLSAFFESLGVEKPFDEEPRTFFDAIEVKHFDRREVERSLISTGMYSQRAAKILASRYTEPVKLTDELRSIKL